MKEENRLILLGRYPQQFVQDTLLPDMEENIARYGVFFPAACEVFQNCRSAENSLYFHHSYAESEIPMGQEYHHIALMEQSRLLLDSVQACRSKVLCFFYRLSHPALPQRHARPPRKQPHPVPRRDPPDDLGGAAGTHPVIFFPDRKAGLPVLAIYQGRRTPCCFKNRPL